MKKFVDALIVSLIALLLTWLILSFVDNEYVTYNIYHDSTTER